MPQPGSTAEPKRPDTYRNDRAEWTPNCGFEPVPFEMTVKQLMSALSEWSSNGQPLVLASVYATEGSTYSKAGAQMLITSDGVFQGMLSGGCLEGDLAERAKAVAESGKPQAVTYDLGQDDEELWGLGVGCDGLIRVFLQRLCKQNNYQPLSRMQAAYEGTGFQVSATVIASAVADLAAGSTLVMHDGSVAWSDIAEKYRSQVCDIAISVLNEKRSQTASMNVEGQSCQLLLTVLRPFPRILVLGAGMDAEPIVRFIGELGWRAVISDHRLAYIENGNFSPADRVCCIDAADISKEFDLNQFDAAIVMSHHLVTDETYLRQLAESRIPYIGLLGPSHRRERLLKSLGDEGQTLEGRLHGPAGLDINATGPASIALSIVAQMHQQMVKHVG